ncbi:MAG: 50S ribosomal protein L24 [Mycoplasmataceae bacterium]|nr:50S ribosomal protein L24 [Mycoplasmataceae bacterium]
MRIKVGDNVIIIAGKEKGKLGVVAKIIPEENRVVVDGINMLTKHVKPTQQNPEGGIEKIEGPIAVSNVMLNIGDSKDIKKAKETKTKFSVKTNQNGKKQKIRIAKKTGEEI